MKFSLHKLFKDYLAFDGTGSIFSKHLVYHVDLEINRYLTEIYGNFFENTSTQLDYDFFGAFIGGGEI